MKLYNEGTSQSHTHIYVYIYTHVNHLMGMSNHISSYIPMIIKRMTMISNNAMPFNGHCFLFLMQLILSVRWSYQDMRGHSELLALIRHHLVISCHQTWTIVSKLCPKLSHLKKTSFWQLSLAKVEQSLPEMHFLYRSAALIQCIQIFLKISQSHMVDCITNT